MGSSEKNKDKKKIEISGRKSMGLSKSIEEFEYNDEVGQLMHNLRGNERNHKTVKQDRKPTGNKSDDNKKVKPRKNSSFRDDLQSFEKRVILKPDDKERGISGRGIKNKPRENNSNDNSKTSYKNNNKDNIKNDRKDSSKNKRISSHKENFLHDRCKKGKGILNSEDFSGKTIKKVCPYVIKCGGCIIQGENKYEEHLKIKQSLVDSLLSKYCTVQKIIGMETPYHYRNKVHAVFDHDRKGNPISGVYEEGTHRVVPIDRCLIHNQKADDIIASIRGMLKSFKIKTYDEDTGYGLLRHVLVRTGFHSGEIMVVLVLSSPIFPSKNNFIKALRQLHPEITTIVLNVNDKPTSMILGEKEQVIYGKGYIEDSLCGKIFRISPKSFYQVNPVQTQMLYGKAIELAGLNQDETAIDAYCGIGTIGLIASGQAKRVIGVELNKDAVHDAIINAKRNQIKNVEFINDDAGEFMSRLAAHNEDIDAVFLDPPRSGSDEKFLNALCQLKPEKVVYISCNPVTLERDLQYLTKKGYKAETAIPVDMFPWTEHVECVSQLVRVK